MGDPGSGTNTVTGLDVRYSDTDHRLDRAVWPVFVWRTEGS